MLYCALFRSVVGVLSAELATKRGTRYGRRQLSRGIQKPTAKGSILNENINIHAMEKQMRMALIHDQPFMRTTLSTTAHALAKSAPLHVYYQSLF